MLISSKQGYKSAVIQDVPVSKPLSRAEVLELQAALDMAQDIPEVIVCLGYRFEGLLFFFLLFVNTS